MEASPRLASGAVAAFHSGMAVPRFLPLTGALGAAALITPPLAAVVRLNPHYCDHAVLQQSCEVPVWGTADEGERVVVEAASVDGVFHPAAARIVGETVEVVSPEGAAPVAVRYGWANVPDCNLFNTAGLPASPFRAGQQVFGLQDG